jgi:hypothetical protein
VTLAIMNSTDLPWSRQRAATVIAAYAACRRLFGGVSDVATTTTARAGADHMIGTVRGRGYMIRDPGAPLNKAMVSALRQPKSTRGRPPDQPTFGRAAYFQLDKKNRGSSSGYGLKLSCLLNPYVFT